MTMPLKFITVSSAATMASRNVTNAVKGTSMNMNYSTDAMNVNMIFAELVL